MDLRLRLLHLLAERARPSEHSVRLELGFAENGAAGRQHVLDEGASRLGMHRDDSRGWRRVARAVAGSSSSEYLLDCAGYGRDVRS